MQTTNTVTKIKIFMWKLEDSQVNVTQPINQIDQNNTTQEELNFRGCHSDLFLVTRIHAISNYNNHTLQQCELPVSTAEIFGKNSNLRLFSLSDYYHMEPRT